MYIIYEVLKAETTQSDQKFYLEFAIMKNLEGIFDLVDPNTTSHKYVKEMQEAYFSNQDLIDQNPANKQIDLWFYILIKWN